MVAVWKQCLTQTDYDPAINQRCHMTELASDTPISPSPLIRPEVELRVGQSCNLTCDEVVQLCILWKEHSPWGIVSDSLQVHRLPFVKAPILWQDRGRRRAALHRRHVRQAMTGQQ